MATKIDYVSIHDDGGDAAYVVIAKIGSRWFHHQGPADYSHFTLEQAEKLACRVRRAGCIDMQFWSPSWVTENEIEERWFVDAMERR